MKNKILQIAVAVVVLCVGVFYCVKYYNTTSKLQDANNFVVEAQNELELKHNQMTDMENEFFHLQQELENTDKELSTTKQSLHEESEKVNELNTVVSEYEEELSVVNATIDNLKSEEYELVYYGNFKITYYCDERYSHICGGNGVTASGAPTEVGWSIATDWSVLPRGTIVYIENIGFREVQDVGGSVDGRHIDVLVDGHQEALSCGTDYEGVWLLVKKTT